MLREEACLERPCMFEIRPHGHRSLKHFGAGACPVADRELEPKLPEQRAAGEDDDVQIRFAFERRS